MLSVYLNYPNSRVTIHTQSTCSFVRSHRKIGQRVLRIDQESLSAELHRISSRTFRFAATVENNDLWLVVDLADPDLELAVAKHVHRQLGKRYKRFRDAVIETHC